MCIRDRFYDEGTRNLLETYEQVDKAFTIFSRSNWNMPVSYTHLDVYKRQDLLRFCPTSPAREVPRQVDSKNNIRFLFAVYKRTFLPHPFPHEAAG